MYRMQNCFLLKMVFKMAIFVFFDFIYGELWKKKFVFFPSCLDGKVAVIWCDGIAICFVCYILGRPMALWRLFEGKGACLGVFGRVGRVATYFRL